jgi:hypothetical protein
MMNRRGNGEGGEVVEQPGRTEIGPVLHYGRPLVVEAAWGMGNGGVGREVVYIGKMNAQD